MYYIRSKLEISHFLHGKMILKTYLKTSHLNDRQTITASELLKPKLLDYFEKIEKTKEILTPFQVCEGIVNLLHPYCFKCTIKLDDCKYIYEK